MLRADGPAVVTPVELHPLTRKPWVDQVPRKQALEAAGALIESAADPTSVTGVRWEGQIIAAGQLRYFEAAELADLCDQMEDVVTGPASRGIEALPGQGRAGQGATARGGLAERRPATATRSIMTDLAGIGTGELNSALASALFLTQFPQLTGDALAVRLRELAAQIRVELDSRPKTGLAHYLAWTERQS